MLPEESDVVCQSPEVSLLLCFSHIPTFVLPYHCAGRVPRVLLASACLLLVTAHGRTRQIQSRFLPVWLYPSVDRRQMRACGTGLQRLCWACTHPPSSIVPEAL